MFVFDSIQNFLNFEGVTNDNYDTKHGLGRIGLVGYLLGVVGGVSGTFFISQILTQGADAFRTILVPWTAYVCLLSLFHFLEFFVTSIYQPSTLSYDSYIVNHSKSYTIAAIVSWIEFWLEYLIFGEKKLYFIYVCYFGIVCTVLGQTIRSLSMSHCGENFSHIIADRKAESHKLVTNGIYRYLRHPSYFGWFYWSMGTQLILMNPICSCAYVYVSWNFFKERIAYEEYLLLKFFGEKYQDYKRKVPVGIPFIK